MNFNNAKFETSYGVSAQLPPAENIEIAFAGRSNVGKSSLLNRLFNRKSLARVSSVPGKTVTINFYDCDGIKMVDLPGYGYAKVSHDEKRRWSELMESYFKSGRKIKLVVQLTDMRHSVTQQDIDMMRFLKSNEYPFIVVMTKCDKLNKTEYAHRMQEIKQELSEFGDVLTVPFSATKGDGAQTIKSAIEKAVTGG
ncbi:MAG: ribosome biogenesis GTP-binding protein YihA/YsxC [Oscillospiraceae bacterium]|nr:ribosome biogenesis GTP-binding protein YihA/YsxC [Ruminococcus sp.]MDY6060696.1 ribosome biogenesis GTP-binding protein YihA/YsxC [Oscillospiraceae bacterium]